MEKEWNERWTIRGHPPSYTTILSVRVKVRFKEVREQGNTTGKR